MPHILEQSTLRILNPDGQTAGAGFIVAPGLAVTCAHVVSAAKSGPGQAVGVADWRGENRTTAEVSQQGWRPAATDDLAFLTLAADFAGLQPVEMSGAQGRDGLEFTALGFPPDGAYGADRPIGKINGLIPSQVEDRADLLQFQGAEIRQGMSGGAVVDLQAGQVVGMICEFLERDGARRAYAVTAETICRWAPFALALLPAPRNLQKQVNEILTLLNRADAHIEIGRDVRDSVIIAGGGNSVSFNLQDALLVQALTPLIQKRTLKSYLLWLTVHPDFLKWNKLFVPLQAQIELPLCYSEMTQDSQGQAHFKDIEITQALQEYPAFVILGQPGAGKTTTLQKIGFEQARLNLSGEALPVPLFVSLSQQDGRSPKRFLAEEWQLFTGTAFADHYTGGKLLILLDGINELPRAERGQQLKAWRHFAKEAVQFGHQVIFSGRELDYDNLLDLPRVLVKPLDAERIRDYLTRREAEGLFTQISDPRNRLWELAGNPFYLNLLVDAYQSNHQQLGNRGRLMAWFVRGCLNREALLDHPGWIPEALQSRALAKLAFAMQSDRSKSTTWTVAEARAVLPAGLENDEGETIPLSAPDLFRLARGAALLDPNPDLRAKVRFFHHLLMEYFAACELLERFAAGEDLARLWQSEGRMAELPPAAAGEWEPLPAPPQTGWEETTILAAGLSPDPPGLIEAVRQVNPVLAGRCLDEAGLSDIRPLRVGGLVIGLETAAPALNCLLDSVRRDLLRDLYDPQTHLRARLQAGLELGKLGDPRLEWCERDGIRYVRPDRAAVPAGRYIIGSGVDDSQAYANERPQFTLELPAFRIGRRPVTNAEFAAFIEAGGYSAERFWQGDLAKAWLRGENAGAGEDSGYMVLWEFTHQPDWKSKITWEVTPEAMEGFEAISQMEKDELIRALSSTFASKSRSQPAYWSRENWNNPAQPVTGITWFEARAYCAWLAEVSGEAYRLPSEVEWEAAARGFESRIYPWGADWDAGNANTIEGRVLRPAPVGAYAAAGGIGPHGEEDQSGNVWEWTLSPYRDYPSQEVPEEEVEAGALFVVRGGSWDLDGGSARCAHRLRRTRVYFNNTGGFRVLSPGAS